MRQLRHSVLALILFLALCGVTRGDSSVVYATYVPTAGAQMETTAASTVDPSGNVYLLTIRLGSMVGAIGNVKKLSPEGDRLIFSTAIGFVFDDGRVAYDPEKIVNGAITTDANGNVYVAANQSEYNASLTTTTESALQPKPGGGLDVLIVKLNPSGERVYSTFFGGSGDDIATGIAVDGDGNVYVTGYTNASDFPVSDAGYQRALAGSKDAFVSKINAWGTSLLYSTLLGGSGADGAMAIRVGPDGSAYITGNTDSVNFPVTAALLGVESSDSTGFITSLNANGDTVSYSTLCCGETHNTSIAIDTTGDVYLAGNSNRGSFTAKVSPSAGTLTYLKSLVDGFSQFIIVDSAGTANVAGMAIRGAKGADAYVLKLDAGGAVLEVVYLGGSSDEAVAGIGCDAAGDLYFTGTSYRGDGFPTTPSAFQTTMPLTSGASPYAVRMRFER